MPTYRSEAILLRRQDFKEYDQLLTVFTGKRGKIEVVARGVKKIQSKLAGHLQPFCTFDLLVARGKHRDRVAGTRMLENFGHLKSNIDGIAQGSYFNETVDLLTRTEQPDQNTYRLIKTAYQSIDQHSQKGKRNNLRDQFLIILSFLLRLLSLQGFQPRFKRCFYCQQNVKQEKNFISCPHLSVVCPNCQKREKNLKSVSPTALKVLRIMTLENFSSLKLTNLDHSSFWEIQEIVNDLLIAVGEKNLKSASLLKDLLKINNQ